MGKLIKEKKQNISQEFKLLTDSLFDENIEISTDMLNNNLFKYQIFNLLLNNTSIIKLLDNHFNDIEIFYKMNTHEFISSVRKILKIHDIVSKKQLCFNKKETCFKSKLFEDYPFLEELNENEQECIISLIQNKKFNISKQEIVEINKEDFIVKQEPTKPEDIRLLWDQINGYVLNSATCQSCPLYKNKKLFFDTNLQHKEDIDILILFKNPTKFEIQNQKSLEDDCLKSFKDNLEEISKKYRLKYLITYGYVCDTQEDIKEPQILKNCNYIHKKLTEMFNPKLIIIPDVKFGKTYLCIKGKTSTQLVNNTLIMLHPQVYFNNIKKYSEEYQNGFNIIEDYFKISNNKEVDKTLLENSNYFLWDVREISDEQYVIILSNGKEKKKIVQDIRFPIYIKDGKYIDCDYIEDIQNMNFICNLTNEERKEIMKKLFYKLRSNLQ